MCIILCPAEHQMDWNPRNPVVIHCEQRLGGPRSAGACHAVRDARPHVP